MRNRKRTGKRFVRSFLLLCVLSLFMQNMTVQAETDGEFEYTILEDGTVEFTGYQGMETEVVIPDTLGGKTVTGIGWYAFRFHPGLSKVTIPKSVTYIKSFAFATCALTSIEIPANVTDIDPKAFMSCNLTNVTVDEKNTVYDSRDNCNAIIKKEFKDEHSGELLTELVRGSSNTVIPKEVTSIGSDAFSGTSDLTSITIPDRVKYIGGFAFSNCGLTDVKLPDSVISIGESAFSDCAGMNSITIPVSVESIEESAFSGCPENMTIYVQAGSYAEKWAEGTGFVVEKSQPEIGSFVTVSESNCQVRILTNEDGNFTAAYAGSTDTSAAAITIPDTVKIGDATYRVTAIADNAFLNCASLEEVVLPTTLESIDKNAFEGVADSKSDNNLKVTIPEKVKDISMVGIENITNIQYITILVAAGSEAEVYLQQYNNVVLVNYPPATDNSKNEEQKPAMGDGIKEETPSTEKDDSNNLSESTEQQIEASTGVITGQQIEASTEQRTEASTGQKTETTLEQKNDLPAADNVEVPATQASQPQVGEIYTIDGLRYQVTSDQTVAFMGGTDKNIKSLTISAKVTILNHSFKVTAIEKRAMKKYKKLTTVTIGKNVMKIGDEAFMNCSNLKTVIVGQNVKTIGKKVFSGDKKLMKLRFKGAKITKIGKKTMRDVSRKVSIKAPKKAGARYTKLLKGAM